MFATSVKAVSRVTFVTQVCVAPASCRLSRGHPALALRKLQLKRPETPNLKPCYGARAKADLRFLGKLRVLDDHVLEFAGFEDLTAFLAFNEFRVFFARNDLHARMLAWWQIGFLLGEWGRRGWSHKSGYWAPC